MLALTKIFSGVMNAVPGLRSSLTLFAPGFVGGVAAALVDGAAIAINATLGSTFTFVATTNAARVFSVPTGGVTGQRITIRLSNTSGGALTVTTFNAAIKQGTVTLPATGQQREYVLQLIGSTWALVLQSTVDIPN